MKLLARGPGLLPDRDVARIGQSLQLTATGVARRPVRLAAAGTRFGCELGLISFSAMARAVGLEPAAPFEVDPHDRRFDDPAWQDNPAYYSLRQCFLALTKLTEALVTDARLDPTTEGKARMATGLILDLIAPTNFPLNNPAVLKRAFDTGGTSILKGVRNLVDDVVHNHGQPRQVDRSGFTVGENLAATPCKVVYRNEFMELLQYEPQTSQIRQARSLVCTPSPDRSRLIGVGRA